LTLPLGHLVKHRIADRLPLPPIEAAMYEYVMAANGLFKRGRREGLEATVPVHYCEIRGGLASVEPEIVLHCPKVPQQAVEAMLTMARSERDARGRPVEILFHLAWSEGHGWRLTAPEQIGTAGDVRPLQAGTDSSYANALIEVHSHHQMGAFWSSTDNKDEQGFRLYGVLGDIFDKPRFRVRVGLYGHFWEVPAESLCNLPEGMNKPNRVPARHKGQEVQEQQEEDGYRGAAGAAGTEEDMLSGFEETRVFENLDEVEEVDYEL
jgi:PRTRC genetic system protein A